MSRSPIAAMAALTLFLLLAGPQAAHAQVVGWATPHVGQSYGGATTDNGTTYGLSVAAFDWRSWLGVEVDLAHTVQITDEQFGDSSASTLMVNLILAPPGRKVAPYAVAGAGGIRVRGCVAGCVRSLVGTEFGFDAGGGVQVRLTELLAARADLRYFSMINRVEALSSLSSGTFDFFRASVGLTFMWSER